MLEESDRGTRLRGNSNRLQTLLCFFFVAACGFLLLDAWVVSAQGTGVTSFQMKESSSSALVAEGTRQMTSDKKETGGSEDKGKTSEPRSADESREKAKAKKNGAPAKKNGGAGVEKRPAQPERFGDPCLLNPNLPVCKRHQ